MCIQPSLDLGESLDAVSGLTGTGQLVVLALEQAHLGLNTVILQCGEHLEALGQRAVVVFQCVDEQGRSLGIAGILQRSMLPQLPDVGPGSALELLGVEGVTDAGYAEVTDGVAEGTLGNQGLQIG